MSEEVLMGRASVEGHRSDQAPFGGYFAEFRPLEPQSASVNGKATFMYPPVGSGDPLRITVGKEQKPPRVAWRVGRSNLLDPGFFIQMTQPVPGIRLEGSVSLSLPTEQDPRREYLLRKGTYTLRLTPEGLTPYLVLSPEKQPDGTYLYCFPDYKTLSFSSPNPEDLPAVLWNPGGATVGGEKIVEVKKGQVMHAAKTNSHLRITLGEQQFKGEKLVDQTEVVIHPGVRPTEFAVNENLVGEQFFVFQRAHIVDLQGASSKDKAKVVVTKDGEVELMRLIREVSLLTKGSGPDNRNPTPVGVKKIEISGRGNTLNGWKIDRFPEFTPAQFARFQLSMEDSGRYPDFDDLDLQALRIKWRKINTALANKPKSTPEDNRGEKAPDELMVKEDMEPMTLLGGERQRWLPSITIFGRLRRRLSPAQI